MIHTLLEVGRDFSNWIKDQFDEGKHYFEVTADELRRQSIEGVFPPRTSMGILITQAGYFLIIKSFQDHLAWDVYRRVVDEYFANV